MQKIDYGVEVLFGQTLYAGKCILQLLKNQQVTYQYKQNESQFNLIPNIEGGTEILHGDECPCENKDLKPNNNLQFSKIRLATVAMLCDKDYNFLITRRHSQMKTFPKTWVFPGGMVEKNQNIENECLREVQEETGIDVSPILDQMQLKLFYESIYPTKLLENQYPLKQTLCMFYEVKLNETWKNLKVKIQETEVDDYKWIHKDKIIDIMNEKTNEEEFEEMKGKYPNKYGSGIGEGHVKAFMHCYKK